MAMAFWRCGRLHLLLEDTLVRGMATRKKGPWHIPNTPIRTARDFDYLQTLKRKSTENQTTYRRREQIQPNPKEMQWKKLKIIKRKPKGKTYQK